MTRFVGAFLLGFFLCFMLIGVAFAVVVLNANRVSAVFEVKAVPLDTRYEGRTAAGLKWSWANRPAPGGQP